MGSRDRLRQLERSAEGEIATLVCQACGKELQVRDGIELDLKAEALTVGARERGVEVYAETPEDVHRINDHPRGWQTLRYNYTSEPLFPWGATHEE